MPQDIPQNPGRAESQAESVRVPRRFPLAASAGFRSTTLSLTDPSVRSPVSDSILLNAYVELDPEDNSYWVEKRLGTKTLSSVAPAAAGGTGVFYNTISTVPIASLAIFGTNLYALNNALGLDPISYAGTHGRPIVSGRCATFIPLPISTPTSVRSGIAVWAVNGELFEVEYDMVGALITMQYFNIVDTAGGPVNIPWVAGTLCDGCAWLDGTLYVMDQQGSIWGSNTNRIDLWASTTVIAAGGRGDLPVYLAQQLEYIIALKSTSVRCFYNAGAAAQTAGVGSNLAWVEGADSNFGCANGGSVQLIDETLIWVSNNTTNTPQIVRMDALKITVISTPPVERFLQQLPMSLFSATPSATTNILYSNGIKRGGHRFYTITALAVVGGGTPFTLAYDLDQEQWYVWYSPGRTYWSVIGASAHGSPNNAENFPGVYAQDITSGAFYDCDIDQVYPTDSGTPCQVDIYTPNADMGTRRKKQLNALYFVNDQVSGSYMQVRKSDDDYRSWSPLRRVALNVRQPSLTRCGTFRRRALNIRHSAPTPFRIKAADAQLDIGTL